MASTWGSSRAPAATISFAPPGCTSSACWKISFTEPLNSSRMPHSTFATPSRQAVCMSCPQACMTLGVSLAKGRPVSSGIGSASMSARRATHLPSPARPRIRATTAVAAGVRISSTPYSSSFSRTRAEVRSSFHPVSG